MPVPTALPKLRCHCLTSLSEPAADGFGGRFRNGKTPWHAGPKRRIPKPRYHCLTSLSEPAADCFGGRFRNGKTLRHAGPNGASESLSEPARKLAFEACSWRLWQPLPKTGKHHGMPVPTALPKPRCHCLTSLSEPAADCFGGRFRNGKIPSHASPNGASEAPVPVLNNAFWAR